MMEQCRVLCGLQVQLNIDTGSVTPAPVTLPFGANRLSRIIIFPVRWMQLNLKGMGVSGGGAGGRS